MKIYCNDKKKEERSKKKKKYSSESLAIEYLSDILLYHHNRK